VLAHTPVELAETWSTGHWYLVSVAAEPAVVMDNGHVRVARIVEAGPVAVVGTELVVGQVVQIAAVLVVAAV